LQKKQNLWQVIFGCIGVVFGDIGTSPLYTIKACFLAQELAVIPSHILGVISLILYALIIVVSLKYMMMILRADNNGEGGTLALSTLCLRLKKYQKKIITLGLIGTVLFYGDGVITPSISVLGALEGMTVISPAFAEYIVPLSLIIVFLLFIFQKKVAKK